uniref:glycosyltransferase family 4 protein n=1 Tax=Marinobacterium profundum TaxID=1714300 RepID=UPI0034E1C7C3
MASQTAELCHLLEQEGAQVALVAVNAPYRPAWIGRWRGLRALFRLLPYLRALWCRLGRADVVHLMANSGWSWYLFATPAIWIAYLRGTPIIVNYRGGNAAAFFKRDWRWIRPTLRRASACVVPSGFLAEVFAGHQLSTRIIPNTLDPSRFFPANPAKPRASPTSAGPILLITRNLELIYGIDLALQALPAVQARFPGVRLVIAGSGPERASLKRQAEDLGVADRVEFRGRLARQEVAELYRQADLLLNPSRVDNSPNSIIEALGSALPVVSTRAGGIPKLVTDGETALLVDLEDSSALAAATLRVLEDDDLRNRLKSTGLSFSRRFHWDSVKKDLLHSYQQAIETKK